VCHRWCQAPSANVPLADASDLLRRAQAADALSRRPPSPIPPSPLLSHPTHASQRHVRKSWSRLGGRGTGEWRRQGKAPAAVHRDWISFCQLSDIPTISDCLAVASGASRVSLRVYLVCVLLPPRLYLDLNLSGERARCSFSYTEAPASSLALALAPALPSGHCGVSSYSVATRASRLHVASRAARAFSSGRRRALRRAGADQPACHQRCRACIVLVCAAAAPLGSSATSSGHSLWQSHHARTHAHARTCTHAHLNTDSTDTRTRPRACPHTRVRAHVHFPARTHTRMCMHSRAHPRV